MHSRARRTWWSRAAALFAAAWCAVALGTPIALPAAVARATAGHATEARAGEESCAGAMHHAAHRGSRPADHGCCVCFGPCCHATAAGIASPPPALVADVAVLGPQPEPPTVRPAYHPSAPEHARPPSVGPPVGLSA